MIKTVWKDKDSVASVTGAKKQAPRDGESNPGLPRTEQVLTCLDMTGGDTYHYTITDLLQVKTHLYR